jgi:hypothetical protein
LKTKYDRNRQEGEQEVGSDVDDYRKLAEVHTALVQKTYSRHCCTQYLHLRWEGGCS